MASQPLKGFSGSLHQSTGLMIEQTGFGVE